MSIWTRITKAIEALRAGESLSHVFDTLKSPPELSIGFTIAVIALGAKMAKADGQVTRDEVTAFREVFVIPAKDEAAAAKVFNLARQDAAGYETYARRIARMFDTDDGTLCDLMEGLFHIAVADGDYHPAEDDFLARVATIFGVPDASFRSLRSRFVPDAEPDPWDVLGLSHDNTIDEAQAAWRQLVRNSHPDQMFARGLPKEAIKMAETRLIDINRAWDAIREGHA